DARQIQALLLLGSMPKQGAHRVHLCMSRPGITTASIDLFQDDRRFNKAHTQASILPRNKRSEIASLRERAHKGFRIRSLLVEFSPVAVKKLLAQSPHSQPQLRMRFGLNHIFLSLLHIRPARTSMIGSNLSPAQPP